jgi:hypothetical protein
MDKSNKIQSSIYLFPEYKIRTENCTNSGKREIGNRRKRNQGVSVDEIIYVHVNVRRNKFLYNKTNKRTDFPNFILANK